MRERGTVKLWNDEKGWGFIRGDDGRDVVVHYSQICGRGHRTLEKGQRVEYGMGANDRGLCAADVVVIEGGADANV